MVREEDDLHHGAPNLRKSEEHSLLTVHFAERIAITSADLNTKPILVPPAPPNSLATHAFRLLSFRSIIGHFTAAIAALAVVPRVRPPIVSYIEE
jgi:hypothetical protein